MNKSLYEILGLKEGASTDEVRSAYRVLAKKYHPDTSSDPNAATRFDEVTRAYKILINPGSRLLYDETGATEPIPDTDEAVKELLKAAFGWAIEHAGEEGIFVDDILTCTKNFITNNRQRVEEEKAKYISRRDKLQRQRDKVIAKRGDNLFHEVIDIRLTNIKHSLKKMDIDLAILAKGIEVLNGTYSIVLPKADSMIRFHRTSWTETNITWSEAGESLGDLFIRILNEQDTKANEP